MNSFSSERGQGLVEYALILILIAVAAIIAVTTLGETTNSLFNDVSTEFDAMSGLMHFI